MNDIRSSVMERFGQGSQSVRWLVDAYHGQRISDLVQGFIFEARAAH